MIIEQETITTIKADEGKILVRKSDGQIVGDTIHLGYDYYDAGVVLSNPRLMKPEDYEEIDIIACGRIVVCRKCCSGSIHQMVR